MKYVAYITLTIALLLISYFAFNLLYPYNPIIIDSPAKTNKLVYKHGETIATHLNIQKFDDKSCKVSRQFVDTILYTMPTYYSNMPIGTYDVWDSTTFVPESLPSGKYYVLITLEYTYPPFRKVNFTFRTTDFIIDDEGGK